MVWGFGFRVSYAKELVPSYSGKKKGTQALVHCIFCISFFLDLTFYFSSQDCRCSAHRTQCLVWASHWPRRKQNQFHHCMYGYKTNSLQIYTFMCHYTTVPFCPSYKGSKVNHFTVSNQYLLRNLVQC